MSLSIDALRSFVLLAEELHFGRAAIRLHVSQPALTKQIKRLESEIGGRLFERTTGRVLLTPAGDALRDRARVLVKDASALESFARQAVLGNLERLRIGCGIAAAGEPVGEHRAASRALNLLGLRVSGIAGIED